MQISKLIKLYCTHMCFSILQLNFNEIEKSGFSFHKMSEADVIDKEFKEKMEITAVTFKHLNPKCSLGLGHI